MEQYNLFSIEVGQNLSVGVDILLGLKCLHDNRIIHDMKPSNNFSAVVADFSLCKLFEDDGKLNGQWGTLTYQSPDQVADSAVWAAKTDIFVVGGIFIELIFGRDPFPDDANYDEEVRNKIR